MYVGQNKFKDVRKWGELHKSTMDRKMWRAIIPYLMHFCECVAEQGQIRMVNVKSYLEQQNTERCGEPSSPNLLFFFSVNGIRTWKKEGW